MSQVLAEMRLFFHKASVDGGFYQHWLADNEQICQALEAGDPELAAERLTDYLDRSEDHQAAVHAAGSAAVK
ncbi:MAG: GntR family transcriptional regulator, partial [Pseudarthrobacter sp.]|nr:GntR family transcriptional regulator [Pseudarthrobacter sp.]